jgi:hypothetical protein
MSSIEENVLNFLLGGVLGLFIIWVIGSIMIMFDKKDKDI